MKTIEVNQNKVFKNVNAHLCIFNNLTYRNKLYDTLCRKIIRELKCALWVKGQFKNFIEFN